MAHSHAGALAHHSGIQDAEAPIDLQKIGHYMAKLKVQGLPRNYQLFHEALFGHNREIAAEIGALGSNPSQPMLDEIGLKHRLVSHCGLVADKSNADAAAMLREVASQLNEGLQKKQGFMRAVETVAHSVAEDQNQSLAQFTAEMDFLNASLTNLMLYETELTEKLKDEMEKLEALESGNAAIRAAAATDRITGLPNQIALINRLTDLYEDGREAGTALFLVDIDDFRAFNNKYGPQPANHLLKKLGMVFRKSVKKNDFVARLGGDDFSFIFSDVGTEDALAIATRLRASVEENLVYATSDKTDPGRLTISIGIALGTDASSAAQLMGHAEKALTAAQANRRKPIQIFQR
ncbi:GGDEF domain-containing protein [Rhizobium sp. BK376]|uniref:GGDEF domain-containing protein n=1 Tax=Rhizobium sp. BK376 TaxID=2512149 RepID=UPI00104C442C|nr:GGDEF domain-containing protein [Rhizobium sp. BK376]TCR93004.1 diguanylate cyclase (GGDEF)-like protein [Rhizobium sp. BK376]